MNFSPKIRPKSRSPYFRHSTRFHEWLEARVLLDGAAAYGQLPLSFEINQGQAGSQVNFLAHGNGYGLFLTPSEAVLSLRSPSAQALSIAGMPTAPSAASTPGDVLQMQFLGANSDAAATGVDKLASVSNYLIGNDPSKWHTNVPNYGRVEYQNLYTGIDLTYYGNQRQLEYDFTVAPGADPAQIAFQVAGAKSISLNAQGNLVLHTSGGDVSEHVPVIYQQTAAGRKSVGGHYTLSDDGRVGFAVGGYDHSQPLVIDPILSYSTYLRGLDGAETDAYAIAVDTAGDAYVAGTTWSATFPTTPGALQPSNAGNNDAFVAKLNATGSALIYSTYLGGNGADQANAIAVDRAGEAYVAGETSSTNFPTTAAALQTSNPGGGPAFVAKLNAAGSGLVYSTYLGGFNPNIGIIYPDGATAIAVDDAGEAYVAGNTHSTSFPITAGALQTYNAGGADAFVAKLNAAGSALVYSTYLGGSGDEFATGIAIDRVGDTYVSGFTNSPNFPTTAGALQSSYGGGQEDGFVALVELNGSRLGYATYLGGSGLDEVTGIAIDRAGDAYVTGITYSANFPTTTYTLQGSYSGNGDAFVSKLNAVGSALDFSTFLGGSGNTGATAITVDEYGNAYVAGGTDSTNFPTTRDAPQNYFAGGNTDAFVTVLNSAGFGLLYSTYLGGAGDDYARGIAIDAQDEAYVIGYSHLSTNFPITTGALQATNTFAYNPFVAKLATTALYLVAGQVVPGGIVRLDATEGAAMTTSVGLLVDERQPGDTASNFSAQVDWGDGTTSAATVVPFQNGFRLVGTHIYAEHGQYLYNVTVFDADGDSAFAQAFALVEDAPLFGVSRTATFTEGASLLRSVASFEDADPKGAGVGDYTATIDWGDGQASPGTVVADGAIFDVTGLHQYAADGNYPITVVVKDVRGGPPITLNVGGFNFHSSTTINSTAAVADSLAAKPVNLNVIGAKSFNGAVATFTDADNSQSGATDYTAVINWDDGTTSNGVISVLGTGPTATFSVAGTHLFTSFAGFHTISVAIADLDDGGATTVVDSVLDPAGLTSNQIYVFNAYQSAFGAAGTTDTIVAGASLAAWAARLGAGATHASFAAALVHSDEYYGLIVGEVYQKYLGRAADDSGLAYWVGQLRQGMTDEQLESDFAGASEFYQHAGGSDTSWVQAMYLDILGRAADTRGLAYWTAQLARGADRATVAQGFATSREREAQRINDDYFSDLGRAADPAGQAYWLNAFQNGSHNEDIVAGFLASEEYYLAHSA